VGVGVGVMIRVFLATLIPVARKVVVVVRQAAKQ